MEVWNSVGVRLLLLYLLGVGEVREVLQSERADDGDDGEEATAQEDDPGVLAQQEDVPRHTRILVSSLTNSFKGVCSLLLMEINVTFS